MKSKLNIQNLKCGGCANTIKTNLNKIKGIYQIEINTENSSITFNHTQIEELEQVKMVLQKLGYPVFGEDNNIVTKLKSYSSCAVGKIK